MPTQSVLAAHAIPAALVLADGLTFEEFCHASPLYGRLLRSRRAEIRIPIADQQFFVAYPDTVHFVLIVSEDDPETVAVAPIVQRIVEACPRFSLYILRDEDDLSALDAAVDEIDLSDDPADLDVPLLLLFDEEGEYQAQWGPRPEAAEAQLDEWLEQHPEYEALAEEEDDDAQETYQQALDRLTYEMRVWYNSSLNHACIAEIRALLDELQDDGNDTGGDTSGDEEE